MRRFMRGEGQAGARAQGLPAASCWGWLGGCRCVCLTPRGHEQHHGALPLLGQLRLGGELRLGRTPFVDLAQTETGVNPSKKPGSS